jgi:hypothetical protein
MQAVQNDLAELERLFTLKNKEDIANNLNPELTALVLEAREQVLKYFPGAELELQWQYDPEEAPLDGLLMWVDTDLEVEEGFLVEERFNADWWLENMSRAEYKLAVMVN